MNNTDKPQSPPPAEAHGPDDLPSLGSLALPPSAEHGAKHSRRVFLFKLAIGLNAAVGAVLAVPVLGYVLAPMFRKSQSYNSWIPLTRLDNMPVGATRLLTFLNPVRVPTDGETAKIPCWARRVTPTMYEVFAINCAHLGCPVQWFEQSQLFLCPCHGGCYYANGEVAAGPPPRGLYKYKVRTEGDLVLIDAGELPTLRTVACNDKSRRDLIQIHRGPETARTSGVNLLPPGNGGDAA